MTSKTDHNPRQGNIARRSHRKLIAAASAAAVVLVAIAIFIWPYLFSGCASAAVIRIPAHASAADISDSLARYFGDRYAARTMRIFNSLTSDPAQRHGAYDIPKGSSPVKAARILARGGETQVTLTINGVRQYGNFKNVYETVAGCTVSCHCGPGTMGILFVRKA